MGTIFLVCVCIMAQIINTCVYGGLRLRVYGRPRIRVCMVVQGINTCVYDGPRIRVYGSPRN